MPARTLLLLLEGPHDVEFCARLLKPAGFSRVQSLRVLERDHGFWQRTVPRAWPQADDLLARHPAPLFLGSRAGQSVALINAIGCDRLVSRLGATLSNLDAMPEAVAVVLDADGVETPMDRFNDMVARMSRLADPVIRSLQWPTSPGTTYAGPPKTGIFILPDNQSQGTLEELLLDAGHLAYPQLLRAAENYVTGAIQAAQLQPEDLEEFQKPAGQKKATAAAMASVLKPGKSIQVSIQDNRWLEPASLNLPRIRALNDFLQALLA